jgi:four helix bundle protein
VGDDASDGVDARRQEMKGFRELRVWQAAMDLAEATYRVTQVFPKHETYGLASQMQRAAVSVAANIAEGHARRYLGEYLHFLSIARGSLAELSTYFELSKRLAYVPEDKAIALLEDCSALARQLTSLRNALEAKRS